MEPFLPLGFALLLGLLHTFEADHLAAVGAFVARRPEPGAALTYGFRWALGHGGVVLVAGTVLFALQLHVSGAAGAWLERLVGLSLVLLGGWVAITSRSLHAHRHTHADGTTHTHLHSHRIHPAHDHGHAATAMGALHGLAGTAPVVALAPVASFDAPLAAAAFLALFATGTAVSMTLYSMFAGRVAGRAALHSARLGRALASCAGLGTIAVGVAWLLS